MGVECSSSCRLTNATWAADSAGVLGDQAEENDSARLIQDMASPSLEVRSSDYGEGK